jgi:Cu/Ag efflux protein CusF
MQRVTTSCAALLLALLFAAPLSAQQPVSKSNSVSATATIEAIDHTNRLITIKGEDGTTDTIYAGPEVKRFDELKVGDKIKATYYESVVYQLRKPGEPEKAANDSAKMTKGTGGAPSATLARQANDTVEVVSVDPATPAITVKTSGGSTITRKIKDKKNIEGLKPGDKIDITYTQAALISVVPAK